MTYCKEFYKSIDMIKLSPSSTEGQIIKLHKVVDKGLDALRKIQITRDDESIRVAKLELRSIIGDVAMALTGENIYFKDQVDAMSKNMSDKNLGDDHELYISAENVANAVNAVLRNPVVKRLRKKGQTYITSVIDEAKRNLK